MVTYGFMFGKYDLGLSRLFPYLGYTITDRGMLDWPTDRADRRPILLSYDVRLVVTACLLLAVFCFFCFLYVDRRYPNKAVQTENQPPKKVLLVLLIPFSAVYLALFWPQQHSLKSTIATCCLSCSSVSCSCLGYFAGSCPTKVAFGKLRSTCCFRSLCDSGHPRCV